MIHATSATRAACRRFTAAAFALLFASGALGAQDSLRAPTRKRTVAEDLLLFSQVFNQIRVNHPDSLDPHALLMSAIEGMVSAADPHSYVIPATRLDSAKEAAMRAGRLYPIPIDFQFVDGAALVGAVAPGSRALSLDILPGDELVAVDGHPVAAASAEELDLALSGAKSSSATLTLQRRRADGSIARLERTVVRERVDDATAVPAAIMLDSTTGYIRVTTFVGDKVADDLHGALGRLEAAGMHRLVLDLRGNGGGTQIRRDRHGTRATFVLENGAPLSDHRARRQRNRERVRAGRRGVAGSRSRADRRTRDVWEVASDADLPAHRRITNGARDRTGPHAMWPRDSA